MKRNIIISISIILAVLLGGSYVAKGKADLSNVTITLDDSSQFSESELNQAIEMIKKDLEGYPDMAINSIVFHEKQQENRTKNELADGYGKLGDQLAIFDVEFLKGSQANDRATTYHWYYSMKKTANGWKILRHWLE